MNYKPYSIEAEEALIGALLINPDDIPVITTILSPDAFYLDKNRIVYEAILVLAHENISVTFLTLSNHLHQTDSLDKIGGDAGIIAYINTVPNADNTLRFANVVLNLYRQRQMESDQQESRPVSVVLAEPATAEHR